MRKTRAILILLCLWCGLIPVAAQSVKIIKELEQNPFASAVVLYKNDFGSFEKPDLIDTFPYAVIRMHLTGSGQAVREAKERLTLDVGQMFRVESRVTTYTNQIVFLVKAKRLYMLIDCGDGCEKVVLNNMQQLRSNCVYDCTVQFIPESEQSSTDTVYVNQGPALHPFNLHVTPANAQVVVVANGVKQEWILENGEAKLNIMGGQYQYTISAPDHFTQEGTLTVDAAHTDTTINLISKFGSLSVTHEDSTLTVDVQREGAAVVTYPLPLKDLRCNPGHYILSVRKPRHIPWTDTLEIKAGDKIALSPVLLSKKKGATKSPDTNIATIPDANKGNANPRTTNTLFLAEVGLAKNPEWGVGLMFGQMYNGVGWYLKGRSNFTFQSDVTGEISSYSALPDCKSDKSSEWLLDAGLVFDFLAKKDKKSKRSHFGMYLGAGYGARTRYLETFDYGWQKYLPNSYSGFSVDAGVIGSIHGFTLSAGVNTIGFKYMEIELGIGWTF